MQQNILKTYIKKIGRDVLVSVAAFAVMLFGLGAVVAIAAWNNPTSNPPGGNTAPPLTNSTVVQVKQGPLGIEGVFRAYSAAIIGDTFNSAPGSLHVYGSLRVEDGTEGNGKVLTSDDDGNARWETPAASGGGGGSSACVSVTTAGTAASGDIKALSLLVEGSNICSDIEGCTYRIWNKRTNGAASALFIPFSASALNFKQATGCPAIGCDWGTYSNWGRNGNNTVTNIASAAGFSLQDDRATTEEDQNKVTVIDTNDNYDYAVIFCD